MADSVHARDELRSPQGNNNDQEQQKQDDHEQKEEEQGTSDKERDEKEEGEKQNETGEGNAAVGADSTGTGDTIAGEGGASTAVAASPSTVPHSYGYYPYPPPYPPHVGYYSRFNAQPHPGYTDTSSLSDPFPDDRRNRGGVLEPFPEKLHRMLYAVEREGLTDVVSFFVHGRAFGIFKPKRFAAEVMPRFFRQTKFTSFQRQLNLYGFKRITRGPDNGGYYHELFLRGRPGLCVNMKRVKIKGAEKGRAKSDPEDEPNFYAMPPIKPGPVGAGGVAAPTSPSVSSPAGSAFPTALAASEGWHVAPPGAYPYPPPPYYYPYPHPPYTAAQAGVMQLPSMAPPYPPPQMAWPQFMPYYAPPPTASPVSTKSDKSKCKQGTDNVNNEDEEDHNGDGDQSLMPGIDTTDQRDDA